MQCNPWSFQPDKVKAYYGRATSAISTGNANELEEILTSAEGQGTLHAIVKTGLAQSAILDGQAECLRVVFKFRPWFDGDSTECAAVNGNLSMMRLAHELGDSLTTASAQKAVLRGHIDCLAFALGHDCPVDVDVLRAAVSKGHLACVELLVAHGQPRHPYIHADHDCSRSDPGSCPAGPFGPAQMRSLTHILDKGRPIHTGTLILAARIGDVDCVRFLHSRGVGLWDQATLWDDKRNEERGNYEDSEEEEEEDERDEIPTPSLCLCLTCQPHCHAEKKIMTLPSRPQHAPHMWGALWYAWAKGAPLSPAYEAVFRAKRRSARALLCCFHVAARLGRRKRHRKLRAAWYAMGRMPADLVNTILLLADLEIPELLRRPLPKESTLRVQVEKPQWAYQRTPDVWVCALSSPSDE